MEGSDGSPPQSLCLIRAAELFPKPQMEKEDTELSVPFQELAGESVKYLGRTDDGVLALSNYRLFLLKSSTNSETSVPLGLIESAQTRDLFHLIVSCKDASTVKCSFEIAEQCSEWHCRIQDCVGVPETLESLFAFPFCSWTCDGGISDVSQNSSGISAVNTSEIENIPFSNSLVPDYISARLQRATCLEDDFMREVERLGFDLKGSWRISTANEDFKLCPSYPKKVLVPCCISDEMLHTVANFRGSRRLPAVVWRHKKSCAVIARCSQPEVGWLGWRNAKDEQLLKAIADACAFDRGEQTRRTQAPPSEDSAPSSPDGSHEEVAMDEVRKVLIVDARSYTSAVTNRARGGGCECIEYYPCAEIEFMNLGNIHVIRKSFQTLRQLCASSPDVPNWLGLLEKTMWLHHLSGLLAAAMTVCHAIEKKGRPVLVHCSDGWDRTPQIVATAQLCLDPYYRTVEGFRVLVEREWLSFGHKFSDRCGHGPSSTEVNERCPVFLQWLDLVHQIHKQFPCCFEFSMGYLIKLAQHSLSCLFGTFLCNTLRERIENSVFERTFSVWPFLSGPMYRNPLYVPNKEKVLWPAYNVRDLHLWTEVYLGSLGNQNSIDFPVNNMDSLNDQMTPMTKTRSYGDLINTGVLQNGISRRSSDPNMTADPILTPSAASCSENESIEDIQSDQENSSTNMATLINDTTKKLLHLTMELNNEDDFKILQKPKHLREEDGHLDEGFEQSLGKQYNEHKEIHNETGKETLSLPKTHELESPGTADANIISIFSSPNNYKTYAEDSNPNKGCEIIPPVTAPFKKVLHDAMSESVRKNSNSESTSEESKEDSECLDVKSTINGEHKLRSIEKDNSTEENNTLNSIAMESVAPAESCVGELTLLPSTSNIWHGSVSTSTDTLVPIISKPQHQLSSSLPNGGTNLSNELTNSFEQKTSTPTKRIQDSSREDHTTISKNKILPKIHSSGTNGISNGCSNILKKSENNNSSLSDPITITENIQSEHLNLKSINGDSGVSGSQAKVGESIQSLPEQMDIPLASKSETIGIKDNINSHNNNTQNSKVPSSIITTPYPNSNFAPACSQRRRRSSRSKRDAATALQVNNGSNISRFSIPGVRSLPMTPPGLPERAQMAISCPDGLAHALSEQNIRLQQIVHEHKLREDVLLREIHDMRMALLKKTCPNCNIAPVVNDEQGSVMDHIENASICSWEAVEDRSGPPSSSNSSSLQPNTASVLWVPDHAVSSCTSCQTEFWLGRRKHHCRSCGQIFCADCSEFWAPLPDEKLFNPVRLCGPCYHSVTTRMQVSQLQNSALIHMQQSATQSAAAANVVAATTVASVAATSKA